MSLPELFTAHLQAPSRRERGLIGALERAGLGIEASAYRAWCAGAREVMADGIWFAHRVTVDRAPPTPTEGALWFDICELALMLYVGRAWIATRPTARWQMRGFLEVSSRIPRAVQLTPPYKALDPVRLGAGDELARCTDVTRGEATLYAWWFGKMVPHRFDWVSAAESLPDTAMAALWEATTKEWSSTRVDDDESASVFVTRSTCALDANHTTIRGEYTRDREIGMRTAVPVATGLLSSVSSWHLLAEDVRLEALLDRTRFR